MEPIHFSLSTTKTKPLTYSLFNGVTDSEEEAILNLFPFFGANSLAKNVSEKQHVFCRHRIQSEHPREHAARGGLILTGFSLTDAPLRMSQTKMTTGGVEAGGNRVWTVASRIGGRR
jgi:hypothetical protein